MCLGDKKMKWYRKINFLQRSKMNLQIMSSVMDSLVCGLLSDWNDR